MGFLPAPQLELERFDGIPILTDGSLYDACGVRVAFTGRKGGFSDGPYAELNPAMHVDDDPAVVARNRSHLMQALGDGVNDLVVPVQVHGTNVMHADSGYPAACERQDGIEADAVIVDQSGIAAMLFCADCLPLVLVAPSGAFAVVHAGWRGALAGIAGKAAGELCAAAFCSGSDLTAYIGPHIRRECFETAEDVAALFASAFGEGVLAGKRHVDLACAVCVDLARAGMRADRIADCGICVVCRSDEFFSYRASGGVCGRNSVVAYRLGMRPEM